MSNNHNLLVTYAAKPTNGDFIMNQYFCDAALKLIEISGNEKN